MSALKKFKNSSVTLFNVYGGAKGKTDGTGPCHGTGCSETKANGVIIDWDDIECGDTETGENSGKCDPVV